MITLSDVVAASLMSSPELFVGHDDLGAFVRWDSFEISMKTGEVKFKSAHTELATMKLGGSITDADTVTFQGFDGRLRISTT